MKKYVAGAIFDLDGNRILLILKTKPVWQTGSYNLIGGKIEPGETPLEAMKRESFEECGLNISTWGNFCELKGEDWSVEFFYTFTNKFHLYETKTSEKVEIFNIKNMPHNILPNLNWLVPMARYGKLDRADKLIITEIEEENRPAAGKSVNNVVKSAQNYIEAEQFELPFQSTK